nr:DUF2971 domain-containing protein [uncultured Romboutsia sp.]
MNEEFDLEKYREENPMDYIKAIELINQDPTNPEIQKAIYQVTRLHIPDKIYKYFSLNNDEDLNKIKLETLKNKKVYLSESLAMNDPFEGKAFFYDNKELVKYERLSHCDGRIIDDFSDYTILTSFTRESVNCMPMWAHYANNHAGFCVEYDTNKNIQLKGCLFPVQYTDKRIDITKIMDELMKEVTEAIEANKKKNIKRTDIKNTILIWITAYYSCIKHKSWSYEKEIRCITSKISPSALYMNAEPLAIYIGMNCNEFEKKELFDIAYELDIPLY